LEVDGSDSSDSVGLSFKTEMFVWTKSILAIDNAAAVSVETMNRAGVHAKEDL
jgi:hypothetical protein